ncbi:DUF1707 domain-containing protein [Streptomyces sp. A7024]|uniref:DUF1707 domain-containing protein n=1 Tax=Streptomyces coryli TaxID=1128680 RepID=A0A6G4U4M6_9ACTN|nr:DUF1707 and FHA domain-containing protein [Streptomyces coryli]NGN66237.1 DUF1707 domain-containing protein [Streptomyces coryli]
MTASFEFPTSAVAPVRISDAERDRVLAVLREGAAQGRLSQDTFLRRMELAFAAKAEWQLEALTADLPKEGRLSRAVIGSVAKVSAFGVRVRTAWQNERLPSLMLPVPGSYPLRIGRDPVNGLRIMEETVSRSHAELSSTATGLWLLRDLRSTNGTFVNGRRITGAAPVHPGDQVGFGHAHYRLTGR